ncbi:MAG: glycosyltransferase family 4 protein [Bermanella sp.]
MKYIFVVPSMPMGGAEKQISYLVDHLSSKVSNQGEVVALLQGRPEDVSFGLDVMQSGQANAIVKMVARMHAFVVAYFKLLTLGQTFVFYNQLFLPLAVALKFSGKRVAFSIREYDKRFYSGWRKYCLQKMNLIYTNTERVSNESSLIGCDVKFVRNFHAFEKEASYRPNKSNDSLNCVIVSNVEPHKHIHIAIKALEGFSCKLEVLGKCDNPEYLGECKRLAQELGVNACFHGFVNSDDVNRYLRNADLFLHPSSQEGTSNAILGAIDVGVPMIVSDIPENLAVVSNLQYTFRLADVKHLKDKIVESFSWSASGVATLRADVVLQYSNTNLIALDKILERLGR